MAFSSALSPAFVESYLYPLTIPSQAPLSFFCSLVSVSVFLPIESLIFNAAAVMPLRLSLLCRTVLSFLNFSSTKVMALNFFNAVLSSL